MYRERASQLTGSVVWQRTIATAGPVRVLPDGCMDLLWTGAELLVAGPDTVAQVSPGRPGTRYVGLRFPPGTGPAVLGVPARDLRDRRVPLADLWPAARVRGLVDRLAASGAPGTELEQVARERLDQRGPPDPALPAIVAGLSAGGTVAAAASTVGWAPRRLHRWCEDAFGYGPKTLARILRLHRALDLAHAGEAPALVAAVAGYADQAHLSREVKALSGVTLGALLR